jgi:hypothetical protein
MFQPVFGAGPADGPTKMLKRNLQKKKMLPTECRQLGLIP